MTAMPDCHRVAIADFIVMWTVMMAAMMLPAIVPVVLAFATLSRGRQRSPLATTLGFVAGYLVVWGALALPARALIVAGQWLAAAAPWTSPRAGGVALLACGLYQLTPLKDACLRHCRSRISSSAITGATASAARSCSAATTGSTAPAAARR
jgi:predicted metal-binding membrane protein